jgi:hypothetical protein
MLTAELHTPISEISTFDRGHTVRRWHRTTALEQITWNQVSKEEGPQLIANA